MQQVVGGHVLVIDSGVGGLGVLSQIQKNLTKTSFSYVADEAFFPYGKLDKQTLNKRCADIVQAIDKLHKVDLVVVACNTASTVVLEHLREAFDFPIVGIVPAIKVAARKTVTKAFGILVTEATAKGDYIQSLMSKFADDCTIKLQGSKNLARLAERKLNGGKVSVVDVRQEILPLFSGMRFKEQKRIDHVVLGCTHYPFLLKELKAAAPYEVVWIDPAEAVAKRVLDVFVPSIQSLNKHKSDYYTTAQKSNYKVRNIGFECLIV